jgi:hypothetical protein
MEALVSSRVSTPNITSKWIYFNVDGVLAFQGLKNVVTNQISENGIPFYVGTSHGSKKKLNHINTL